MLWQRIREVILRSVAYAASRDHVDQNMVSAVSRHPCPRSTPLMTVKGKEATFAVVLMTADLKFRDIDVLHFTLTPCPQKP